jgi:hypothetical protein
MATKKVAKKSVKKATKKSNNGMIAAEIGAGVIAAGAAAAAGYYFYGDKKAKKHRQAASKWTKGMKTQVVKEAKAVVKMDQKAMAAIVDRAAAAYAGVRSIDSRDVEHAAAELKRNWKLVEKEAAALRTKMHAAAKKAVKTTKKAVKKVAKKAAKKSAKKAPKKR